MVLALLAGCALPPEKAPQQQPPEVSASLARDNPVIGPGDFLTLNLEMDPTDAQVLFRKEPFDKSSFPVTLVVDGQRHRGRAEVMGSSSRRMGKKSVLLKLDKGQEWQGQRRIALNAMASDGSMLRNRLAWDTIHALERVAPQVHYRRLDVNGQFVGIFLQVEWIRPEMFERFGLGADGQFFSPNSSAFCGNLSSIEPREARRCWDKIAPGDGDLGPIMELSRLIAETPLEQFDTFLQRHFEVDSVIDWILVNTLTNNGDSYNKNYFLYRSTKDDRWSVVPFDFDLAFGNNFDPYLPFPQSVYNDHFVYYYPPNLGAWSPLKEKVLRNDVLRERLMSRLRHLLGLERGELAESSFALWHPTVMGERIAAMHKLLAPYTPNERYRTQSETQFRQEVDSVAYFTRARWHYLQAKLFGEFPWDPEEAHWGPDDEAPQPPPLPRHLYLADVSWQAKQGDELALVANGYGYVLALLENIKAGGERELRFSTEVDMVQPPALTPQMLPPQQCVQRTWYLTLKSPLKAIRADLTLEYLQENSRRNELGASMQEERLELWLYREGRWERLPSHHNSNANTLQVRDMEIPGGQLLRFAACSPRTTQQDAGR